MQEVEIREWLDKLVDNIKDRQALKEFNIQISACSAEDYIHLWDGIEIVSDSLGIKLKREPHDEKYKEKLSFVYKGIEVMQLVGGKNARTD